ncbi:Crp/Fnr family transcriptional regulator [Clostridium aciditolerans]|uniref:Crp/Fnr family transcriptional regulator n=1 Tax=Clostridium aciditolerans TaxID=339861 RepID=A0A934HYA6_9CLOT|nr:Crp/Fnr family transcriptional regulator [Clostridium aciditolerans]MBI6872605.1 Crp/Fnr family transcriptional regulator [Clostridium aciditolerans]
MKDLISILKQCILMKSFSEDDIEELLKNINYSVNSYSKGEIIALEGSNCSSIGIVLSGSVEVQKIYASGKTVTISKLNEGHIFGEVIIFSNRSTYPATIASPENSKVMFISKENILKLSSINSKFLNNFMTLLSNKILMLNNKLRNISYQTIRQKIASYILEEYESQQKLTIKLSCTKKEMAEQLGIPRPSLSRELINMKDEGIIDFVKNTITILDLELLEEILSN